MPYPLGTEHIIDIDLGAFENPLLELQRRASNQKYPQQLLRIIWENMVGEPNEVFEAIATFHQWLPNNTPKDSSYVLHFIPTGQQQGKLHQYLQNVDSIATVWQGNSLILQGACNPLHQRLLSLIIDRPRLVSEEIVGLLTAEYVQRYIETELSYLANQRAVARKKLVFRMPEIKLGDIRKNRWHYFPLW